MSTTDKETHAILSPSGAYRWMTCPGSAVLEPKYEDEESEYAKEGTLAHKHGSLFLEKGSFGPKITREMSRYVRDYVTYVLDESKGHDLLVEQKMDIAWLTSEEGAKGTSDAVVISADGRKLTVIDLKYGVGVKVFVHKNPQLMIYALAAYQQFGLMGEFDTVKMVIHQPRLEHVDEWEIPLADLLAFEAEVRAAVAEVEKARKSNSLDGFLHPGEHCKFCRAAPCAALDNMVAKETLVDFDNMEEQELIAPVDLSKALAKVDLIEVWCKGVRAKVEAKLLAGELVQGFKLVEGRKGNRAWVDEAVVEKALKKLLPEEDVFKIDVITPAAAEKLLKKKKPDDWATIEKMSKRAPGKPSVAPSTDPRPPYEASTADDFDDMSLIDEEMIPVGPEKLEIPAFLKRTKKK